MIKKSTFWNKKINTKHTLNNHYIHRSIVERNWDRCHAYMLLFLLVPLFSHILMKLGPCPFCPLCFTISFNIIMVTFSFCQKIARRPNFDEYGSALPNNTQPGWCHKEKRDFMPFQSHFFKICF